MTGTIRVAANSSESQSSAADLFRLDKPLNTSIRFGNNMSASPSQSSMPLDLTIAITRPRRFALLVFALEVTTDLVARRWPRRLAPLLKPSFRRHRGNSQVDVHFFTDRPWSSRLTQSVDAQVHLQNGRDFGERLYNAVEVLAADGYEEIIVVGGDCPELSEEDISRAVAKLSEVDVVLGPDHRGGTYLIGFHAADRRLIELVVWQRNTDCRQLQSLYAGRPVFLLSPKIDLDTWSDLQFLARREGALHRWLARQLAILIGRVRATSDHRVDVARQRERSRYLTSPPVLAA